ncbi:MAG: trypsin-like serine protease [Myxococcaceae bacterium]|nr:trypsin-like serine protease [Myxococcaceae bacterium]
MTPGGPSYIINPTATPADFDVVVLHVRGVPACSGAVVAPTVVVTAAHCVAQVSKDAVTASVGTPSSDVRVPSSVELDPSYDSTRHLHDLAVLRFDQPLASKPLALATRPAEVGTLVSLAGIGATDASAAPVEGFEPKVNEGTARVAQVEASWLRLDGAPSFSCHGDSGGPVTVQDGSGYRLVGVVTAGDEKCSAYSVVARVDNSKWLTSQLGPEPIVGGCAVAPGGGAGLGLVLLLAAALRRSRRRR